MVLMSSNDMPASLASDLRVELLRVASDAIAAGLRGTRLGVRLSDFHESLCQPRASFVTLHGEGRLRGCIGNLDADRPLVEDVTHNAYAAAFEDPRFPPLIAAEFAGLTIHLSILSIPEPMHFSSEADLIAQLRPHRDGLILEEGRARGTLLPSVWTDVPQAELFLRHVKRKAGLSPDYWSRTLIIKRYVVESVP